MYVYRKTETVLWTVGFYAPDGKWHPESDHSSPKVAADRVAYLNGGPATEELHEERELGINLSGRLNL